MPFVNSDRAPGILPNEVAQQKVSSIVVPDGLPSELNGQSSPMAITFINETQFEFAPGNTWYFEFGRFCSWPGYLSAFNYMTCSVCADDANFFTEHMQGVSGGMSCDWFMFDIEHVAPGSFQTGFSNPLVGDIKASILTNSSKEQAYLTVTDSATTASLGPYQGTDTNGKSVTIWLKFECYPGQHTHIYIKQDVQEQDGP